LPRPRAITVVSLALCSLTLLAGTATTAFADTTDVISVNSASSPDDHLGSLAVDVTSTTAITSLTVHVINQDTRADVLDPAMSQTSSTYTDWARTWDNVWTVTTPITTADLPAGDYTILVDATDQGGTAVTGASAGTWQYTSVPVITVSSDRLSIDYDQPTANVTGTASLRNPDGTTTPYQGQVQVFESWAGYVPVQSDASGNFSLTMSPQYPGGGSTTVIGEVWQSSGTRVGYSNAVNLAVTQDPAKITATVTPSLVQYGSQASITGVVTYQPAGQTGYVPVTRTPVNLSAFRSDNFTNVPDATGGTDATGHFSIPLPQNVGTGWTLEAKLGSGNSLLSFPQVSLSENVIFTTAVTGFTTSINQHWGLSFSGCLAITTTTPGATVLPPVSNLRLQWAAGRNGPWHTISSSIRATGSLCSHGQRFTGTASAPYNYAYYRATFLAAPIPATYHLGFHAANSNVVLAWKYADRIAGLSVSPTAVSRNGKITVKGTLQYYNSGWRNYAGQTILIVLEPAGGSTWYWIVKVRTNSKGQFAATVADPVTAHWGAYFDGNSTHLSVQAGNTYVRVR
jgi:hypothetical protein